MKVHNEKFVCLSAYLCGQKLVNETLNYGGSFRMIT